MKLPNQDKNKYYIIIDKEYHFKEDKNKENTYSLFYKRIKE